MLNTSKQLKPIAITLFGNIIDDNDGYPLKQLEPIAVTLLESIIDDNDEHPQNN
jgi:hypothetical protein